MLNTESIEVLKSVNKITNSAIISYPVTTITNDRRDIFGNVDFSKLTDKSWKEFGIMDLSSFLGSLSVLEEPTITQEDIYIKAKDNISSIEFVTSFPSTLGDFTADPEIIVSTSAANSTVEIPIDVDTITKIRKGAQVFKNLKDLFIIKEGDKIYLKTGNKETFSSANNSFTINLQPSLNTGKDFEIVIAIENFLNLPLMDFTMKIKYNPTRDENRLIVENEIFSFLLISKT